MQPSMTTNSFIYNEFYFSVFHDKHKIDVPSWDDRERDGSEAPKARMIEKDGP